MKIKYLLPLILIAIFAITACKKSNQNPSNGSTGTTGVTGTTGSTGVAGSTGVDVYTTNSTALLKNDTVVPLSGNVDKLTTIIASGKDVYATGATYSNYQVAGYWKNGTLISLGDNTSNSYANAITIKGNDVYVVGVVNNKAALWKNGSLTILPFTTLYSYATAIAINGNDVYICGYYDSLDKNPRIIPCYWKNGSFTSLDGDFYSGETQGIAVNGNDVYIAGFANGTYSPLTGSAYDSAVFWKNGIAQKLATTKNESAAAGIAISNGDVYICGAVSDNTSQGSFSAAYWKNGVINIIQDSAVASCIAVKGTDVYLGGSYTVPDGVYFDYYTAWWKNGVITKPGGATQRGELYGIALASK